MRQPKMKLVLTISPKMTEDKENGIIRLTKGTRKNFKALGSHLDVSGDSGLKESLRVHQAYLSDVKISNKLGNKTSAGFVSESTYLGLTKKGTKHSKIEDAWVSESIDNLNVGSDPEFGLVDQDRDFVYAEEYYGNGAHHTSQFGTDGPCMELRPEHSSTPEDHVKNIKKLLTKGSKVKKVADLDWWCGASYKSPNNGSRRQRRKYTLGGHIHVGNPQILNEYVVSPKNKSLSNPMTPIYIQGRIIRILDELVGLPLTRIDGPDAAWRRNMRDKYGAFGDYRPQIGRFEWRTPSAVWLVHPELALAVIGTVKAVSEESYRVMADKNFGMTFISGSPGTNGSLLNIFGCETDTIVRKKLHESVKTTISDLEMRDFVIRLKRMSTYHKYKNSIDDFIKIMSYKEITADKIDLFGIKEHWLNNKALV